MHVGCACGLGIVISQHAVTSERTSRCLYLSSVCLSPILSRPFCLDSVCLFFVRCHLALPTPLLLYTLPARGLRFDES